MGLLESVGHCESRYGGKLMLYMVCLTKMSPCPKGMDRDISLGTPASWLLKGTTAAF